MDSLVSSSSLGSQRSLDALDQGATRQPGTGSDTQVDGQSVLGKVTPAEGRIEAGRGAGLDQQDSLRLSSHSSNIILTHASNDVEVLAGRVDQPTAFSSPLSTTENGQFKINDGG